MLLSLFQQMEQEEIIPSPIAFVALLNACASTAAPEEGRRIHQQIIKHGYELHSYVSDSLVDMYARCGSLTDARIVFDKLPPRNVVSWNALILGYAKCGQEREALGLFQQMESTGVEPDSITLVALLNICARMATLKEGRCVHQLIVELGCESDSHVSNSLVNMYAKCGSLEDARIVFEKIPSRNVVSWNALILGHVNCGQELEALGLFQQMERTEIEPNSVTFVALLNACASTVALEEGRRIHQKIVQHGCECDPYVSNSLVDMYAKCGSLKDARVVFDKMFAPNAVSWNAMVLGYVKSGQEMEALRLFRNMGHMRVWPDSITLVALLNACGSLGELGEGTRIHQEIIANGCEFDLCSPVLDMYSRCGSMEDVRLCLIRYHIALRDHIERL